MRDPDTIISTCARVSRSKKPIEEILEEMNPDYEEKLLESLLTMGHLSVFEHGRFLLRKELSERYIRMFSRYRYLDWFEESGEIVISGNMRTAIEMVSDKNYRDIAMEFLSISRFLSRKFGAEYKGIREKVSLRTYSSPLGIRLHVIDFIKAPGDLSSMTFIVEGISRVTSHQLVRHRSMSFTQQSQRFVDLSNLSFIKPPLVEGKAAELYFEAVNRSLDVYKKLVEMGIKKEDARYIIPQGISTRIAVTATVSALKNFLKLRLDRSAQWEIRELASLVLKAAEELSLMQHKNK
ncbi:MAG: FAD-dependent thymidylate synthase [Candidatus Methanodesulfokora sp.]|nr:MAG: thymidylate synthase (FAD) [Candidatus Korarchaeota archaeon]